MAGRGNRRLGLRTTQLLPHQALLYVGVGVADVHHRQRHVHHLYRGWCRAGRRGWAVGSLWYVVGGGVGGGGGGVFGGGGGREARLFPYTTRDLVLYGPVK